MTAGDTEMPIEQKWHDGPPPHVGWWNASNGANPSVWRWWNGEWWSVPAREFTKDQNGLAASPSFSPISRIKWHPRWPENARVPRINPETGEVTGGQN